MAFLIQLMVRIHYYTWIIIFIALFTEQIDLGQPRVPRAKTFPDLVLHPVGHFQLAQNQQDQTVQNTQTSLTPQETGSQEIIYDYSDLVYEYPEYDDNDDQYYLLDEAKEQDFSTIKIEKEPATIREDHSRFKFDFWEKIYKDLFQKTKKDFFRTKYRF